MSRSFTKAASIGAGLAALLLLAAPAVAGDTVAEIVMMLEGDLSEELIVEWLDAGGRTLELPTARQLLELRAAGASEELLRELVRRSSAAAPAKPVVAPAPTPAPAPVSGPSPPVDGTTGTGDLVSVQFRLLYLPRFDEDEEPWSLLAYLDGKPLSYVPSGSELMGLAVGDPLEIEMRLPPGRHTLRVLQERHEKRRRGWRHAARAGSPAFAFQLEAGAEARVEMEFQQGWGDLTDPLSYRFAQGDRVMDQEETGGDPEIWPLLCEDSGREAGRDDCVGWASLWPGTAAPPRAEVLEALARFEFRPVPR